MSSRACSKGKRPSSSTSKKQPSKKTSTPATSPWPPFRPRTNATKLTAAYNRLAELEIRSTRFFDDSLLESLKLKPDLDMIFDRVGWGDFYRAKPQTFKKPTLEFLATYSVNETNGKVTFRLRGDEYELTYSPLAKACGLPEGGDKTPSDKPHPSFDEQAFWKAITGGYAYRAQHLKASHIINPCVRLIHRFLTCVFFGKQQVGTVSKPDLFVLWVIVIGHSSVTLNAGAWLATHLLTASDQTSGIIHISGLVTLIACSLGVNCSDASDEAYGHRMLNSNVLSSMFMLSSRDGDDTEFDFDWLVGYPARILFPLPKPTHTTVQVEENYLLSTQIVDGGTATATREEDLNPQQENISIDQEPGHTQTLDLLSRLHLGRHVVAASLTSLDPPLERVMRPDLTDT
ncbi:uncharacterized protein LOC141634316 isoform X2 [Silene latifolia]|uniref:uncharacterized protein LOC141634316 isoform X2 n=1 Tax=Silene latifolia TaxID=37657 RepID=UPI003D77D773